MSDTPTPEQLPAEPKPTPGNRPDHLPDRGRPHPDNELPDPERPDRPDRPEPKRG